MTGLGHIVLYHGAVHARRHPTVQRVQGLAADLRAQVRFMERVGYLVSAAEVEAALDAGHRLDPRWFLLTFDDGYANNLEVVADVLGARPWLVYLSTAHIDRGDRLFTYRVRRTVFHAEAASVTLPTLGEVSLTDRGAASRRICRAVKDLDHVRSLALVQAVEAVLPEARRVALDAEYRSEALMTWNQARALRDAGVAVGGHGADHWLLHPGQPAAEVRRQVHESAARIGAELGAPPTAFAYPNGGLADVGRPAVGALAASPYTWATTTVPGPCDLSSDPRWLLPRITGGSLRAVQRAVLKAPLVRRRVQRTLRTWRATLDPR